MADQKSVQSLFAVLIAMKENLDPGDDPLFALLQSLSPSEKRYVRMYTSGGARREDSMSARLLVALFSLEAYAASRVMEKLGETLSPTALSSEKAKLRRIVLAALREYRAHSDPRLELRNTLSDAEFLRDRALYVQALRVLRKGIRKAEQWGQYAILHEMHTLQRELLKYTGETQPGRKLKAVAAHQSHCLTQLAAEDEALGLYETLFLEQDRWFRLNEENRHKEMEEWADRLSQMRSEAPSFRFTHLRLQTQALWAHLSADYAQALAHFRELAAHWRSQPAQIHAAKGRYARVLVNLLNAAGIREAYALIPELTAEIRGLWSGGSRPDPMTEGCCLFYDLLYSLNTFAFEAGETHARRAEKMLQSGKGRISENWHVAVAFNLAVFWLMTGRYSAALVHVNRLLDERSPVRREVMEAARLLEFILHFELENLELVAYRLRSLSGSRREDVPEQESGALSRMLGQLLKAGEAGALPQAFADLEAWLRSQARDGNYPAGYRELHIWALARMRNCSLIEAARSLQLSSGDPS